MNQPITVLYLLFLLGISLYKLIKEKNKNARFYSLAWIAPILSMICYFLAINGIIEYNYITRNAVVFGVGIEALLFSFALADKINIIRQEKESAQLAYYALIEKQKQILEEIVNNRTIELNHARDILEKTNEVAQIGGWEFNLISKQITWSNVTKKIHEVPEDYQPALESALDFYKEGFSRNSILFAVNKCIQDGTVYDLDLQFITAKGKELWVRAIGQAEFEDGECKRMYGIFQDITKEKIYSEEIQKLNEFQKIILNGTEYSIIATDTEGIIKTFNKGAEEMLGYKAEEIVDITTPAIIHDLDEVIIRAKVLSKELKTTIEPGFEVFVAKSKLGKADSNEWTYIRKDKSRITVELSVTTLRDKNNDITGFLGIAKDITKSKQVEQELIQAKEHAEAANQAKSEFLANMTHELRTPLNGVIGFSDLLIKTKLDEEQKRFMTTLHRSANSLLDLINDKLDFSKIEAGKLELNITEVNLLNLLEQVVDLARFKSQDKNLNVVLSIEEDVPSLILTDPIRLRQVLLNLLGNAIKFTDQGHVEIKIRVQEIDNQKQRAKLLFSVKDTGIGISKKDQEKIFHSFTQADSSTNRKYGGTGLGLSISNQLLALMGTKLNLDTDLDRGSNFYFFLELNTILEPNKLAIKENEENTPIISLKEEAFTFLIVDDNPVNIFLMKSILQALAPGSNIIEANSGKQALTLLDQEEPNLIFMDIQMPEMNGYEASTTMRKLEKNKKIPIIALTAGTLKGEKERCLEAGMSDYITKPVVKKKIESIIMKWLFQAETNSEISHTRMQNTILHFNRTLLLERLENDEVFLNNLLITVKENFDSDFLEISRSWIEKDLSRLTSAAHKLKGTALTLCFEHLIHLAGRLESRQTFEPDVIDKLVKEIKEEIDLLKSQIL